MINYSQLTRLTAVITFILFLILLLAPEVIFILFQIPSHESAGFISRRAAMLFLGIATFSWVARNAAPSETRQALCLGLSLSMLSLAALGIAEFVRGFAGLGIFLAILTETFLGMAYFTIWKENSD